MIPIPWWKRWWSYLFELHVESAPSALNPHLYVSLQDGRYQLCTANAVYSFADKYDNYTLALRRVRPELLHGDVLVLGYGLGSVPHLLEKFHPANYRFTGVELDENVLYLADRYGPPLSSPVDLLLADAYAFVLQDYRQYRLIAMDVFMDDVIPAQFQAVDFLEALRERLVPNGVLLYNCLALKASDQKATLAFFNGAFREVFPESTYLDVDGNYMLVNDGRLLID